MENGRGGSRRQPGLVSVVDTAKAVTISGIAFMVPNNVAAVAAQYARSGIWIAPGATKRAVVERIEFSTTGAATTMSLNAISVAPATLDFLIRNKVMNGSAPTAVQRAFDTVGSGSGLTVYIKAGSSGVYEPKKPLIVTPGNGLVVFNNAINTDLVTAFDITEEANT